MPPRTVVNEKSFILVDSIPSLSASEIKTVQRFLFTYLLHPLVSPPSHWTSLSLHPTKTEQLQPRSFQWIDVVNSMKELFEHLDSVTDNDTSLASLLTSLNQTLSYVNHEIEISTKELKYHVLVISDFSQELNWNDRYKDVIAIVGAKLDTLAFIDISLEDTNENKRINVEMIETLTKDIDAAFITSITDALNYISNFEHMTLPSPEPRDIYHNGSIQIPLTTSEVPNMANLEFKVHMYPLVKKRNLSNYVSNRLMSPSGGPISLKYNYYIEKKIASDDQKRRKVNVDKDHVKTALTVGTSYFKAEDFPSFDINSKKSMIIYGFTAESNIVPWYLKPDCTLITPMNSNALRMDKGSAERQKAIYQDLVQYLASEKLVALVREVKKDGTASKQGVLFPRAYVDLKTEETGVLEKVVFIMVECIYADDEKIPNLPNLDKVNVTDQVQKEMDQLVMGSSLLDDDDLLTCDESLVSASEYRSPFDKLNKKIIKEGSPLLINGTFTDSWKSVVSFNAQQQCISSAAAFEVVMNYLNNSSQDNIPTLWDMYFQDEEANDNIVKEMCQSNVDIPEPNVQVVERKTHVSIDWSQFHVETNPAYTAKSTSS